MVPVLVFDTLQHVAIKLLRDILFVMYLCECMMASITAQYLYDELLLVERNGLQGFLDHSTAVPAEQ